MATAKNRTRTVKFFSVWFKLDGVALLVAEPPDATPPLSKINPFEINHLSCHNFCTNNGIYKFNKTRDVLGVLSKMQLSI